MQSGLSQIIKFKTILKLFINLSLIGLSTIFDAVAADSLEFEWQANSRTGEIFRGVTTSFSAAEASMKAACTTCKYLNRRTTSQGLTYQYLPDPEHIDADYGQWRYSDLGTAISGSNVFSSIGEYLDFKRSLPVNRSSPNCASSTATVSGSWENLFDPPYIPAISEGMCRADVEYAGGLLTCEGGVEVTKYLGVDCNASTSNNIVYRSRATSCFEDEPASVMTIENQNGVVIERKNVCYINSLGSIKVPQEYQDCRDTRGNPCSVSTGNKIDSFTDFQGSILSFKRHYNSLQTINRNSIGAAWRHSFSENLEFDRIGNPRALIWGNGNLVLITIIAQNFQIATKLNSVSDVNRIQQSGDEWHILRKNDNRHVYSNDGNLLRIERPSGDTTSLTYNGENLLETVTDQYGNSISFEYNERLISKANFPDGSYREYLYDDKQRLIGVVFPDITANSSDNPVMTYHYEDSRFPYSLTGITDENGDRYATYSYDANGKAISTEHSQTTNPIGQEKVELDYQ